MKRTLTIPLSFLALLLLTGCCRSAPAERSEKHACAAPENAPASAEFVFCGCEMPALPAELHRLNPDAAGCAFRSCSLAAGLLDWMTEQKSLEAGAAAELLLRTAAAEEKQALLPALEIVSAAARQLCAGACSGMLEDSGYLPRHAPWDADAAERLFAALTEMMKA